MYFENRGNWDNCDNYSPASLNFDIDNGGAGNGRATLAYPRIAIDLTTSVEVSFASGYLRNYTTGNHGQFPTCTAMTALRGNLKIPRASVRCSLAILG